MMYEPGDLVMLRKGAFLYGNPITNNVVDKEIADAVIVEIYRTYTDGSCSITTDRGRFVISQQDIKFKVFSK